MNRKQTIDLFRECEKRRLKAILDSLEGGKSEKEAYEKGYEAAALYWNNWAEGRLIDRKLLQDRGLWAATLDKGGRIHPENIETRKWLEQSRVDFTRQKLFFMEATQLDHNKHYQSNKTLQKLFRSSGISFRGFIFPGEAIFEYCTFEHETFFDSAQFKEIVRFTGSTFEKYVRFRKAIWSGKVTFRDVKFCQNVDFQEAQFGSERKAKVGDEQPSKVRAVQRAEFEGEASFSSSEFRGNANFEAARFHVRAEFPLADFHRHVNFKNAKFHGLANFNAIRVDRAFDLADAQFDEVPNFIQAHFEEAPRLDNVRVRGRMIRPFSGLKRLTDEEGNEVDPPYPELVKHQLRRIWTLPRRFISGAIARIARADCERPAYWRALKRLAIQAHDQDREHEFFAREVRSARFATDWPLPVERPRWLLPKSLRWLNHIPIVFWSPSAWGGFFRFWFGIAYQTFSDCGRSVFRPFAFWAITVFIGALFYLGQNPDVARSRAKLRASGENSLWAWLISSHEDGWAHPTPCFEPPSATGLSALTPTIRERTSAPNEAFHLALRTGFLILDPSDDSAHRTYGCLYGIEELGNNSVPVVPSAVSYFMIVQKLFSAVFIFLFGLALRNMLKMK